MSIEQNNHSGIGMEAACVYFLFPVKAEFVSLGNMRSFID
jgi:hypothetical protein